jgi:glutamate-ammonia-ligase adenylyltransferase
VLASEVASMRARIEREKHAAGPFDVKLARGGLIDCEFAAQFLVLAGLARVSGETTLETLTRAFAEGRIEPGDGERLVLSAALQSAILQLERVADPKHFAAETAPEALKGLILSAANHVLADAGLGAERGGAASFDDLTRTLAAVQDNTRRTLERLLGTKVE